MRRSATAEFQHPIQHAGPHTNVRLPPYNGRSTASDYQDFARTWSGEDLSTRKKTEMERWLRGRGHGFPECRVPPPKPRKSPEIIFIPKITRPKTVEMGVQHEPKTRDSSVNAVPPPIHMRDVGTQYSCNYTPVIINKPESQQSPDVKKEVHEVKFGYQPDDTHLVSLHSRSSKCNHVL